MAKVQIYFGLPRPPHNVYIFTSPTCPTSLTRPTRLTCPTLTRSPSTFSTPHLAVHSKKGLLKVFQQEVFLVRGDSR